MSDETPVALTALAVDGGKEELLRAEMRAIETIVSALSPLAADGRERVIDYAFRHLGIHQGPPLQGRPTPPASNPAEVTNAPTSNPTKTPVDIRSLKEERKPSSVTEMAAIVAYYLSECVPVEERKQYIMRADLEKYFKQAQFPLPARMDVVLPNAASAGYLDALGSGQYKLNPVGYNLVVHGRGGGDGNGSKRKAKKK